MNRIKRKFMPKYLRVSLVSERIKEHGMQFFRRALAERSIEMRKNLYVVFIDYEKAFDRVKHHEITKDLEQIGVDQKDRRLFETFYWEQVAALSIDGDLSEWTNIKCGVREGCLIA